MLGYSKSFQPTNDKTVGGNFSFEISFIVQCTLVPTVFQPTDSIPEVTLLRSAKYVCTAAILYI